MRSSWNTNGRSMTEQKKVLFVITNSEGLEGIMLKHTLGETSIKKSYLCSMDPNLDSNDCSSLLEAAKVCRMARNSLSPVLVI